MTFLNMLNTHHLVARSKGGTNHEDNLREVDIRGHDAFHKVFSNKLPHEQILQLLELNRSILKEEYCDLLFELATIDPEDMYKPEGFRSQHFIDEARARIQALLSASEKAA